MPHIFIASADLHFLDQAVSFFSARGHQVDSESDGLLVTARICQKPPALLILDVYLTNKDGGEICQELRPLYSGKIFIVSRRRSDKELLLGAPFLADAHSRKPIDLYVLERQVHICLEHRGIGGQPGKMHKTLRFGNFTINQSDRTVKIDDTAIDFGDSDFDVLWILAQQAGNVLSREKILVALRGYAPDGVDRSIDMRISRLRKSLGDFPNPQVQIKTIRNKGYLFRNAGPV